MLFGETATEVLVNQTKSFIYLLLLLLLLLSLFVMLPWISLHFTIFSHQSFFFKKVSLVKIITDMDL